MAGSETVQMLAQVPLFSELSRRELQAIARNVKEVSHREGAVLAREGESGLGFFLIIEGSARVMVQGRARRRMGPGDFFGEISLLDGGPRSATVTAESAMRVVGLTQWVFKRLIEQNPAIARKMLKVMAARLRSSGADVRS